MTPDQLAGYLARRMDGPHSEADTQAVAWLAAETIRYLNYASLPARRCDGLPYPATACALLGSLTVMTTRLGQLLPQITDFFDRELAVGRLGEDSGAHPCLAVERARRHLEAAEAATSALHGALTAAQSDVSSLHARDPQGAQ